MFRSVLVYGAIAGSVIIAVMIIGLVMSGGEGAGASHWFGYLTMLIALSAIFFAIKRHRDKVLGGVIKFSTAAILGLGISAVAGIFYVIGWEIHLALTDYAFIGDYTDAVIAQKQASGVTGVELEKLIADMQNMKESYGNPFYRAPITFVEIFPVGVIVTLVSAVLLRNEKFLPAQ